MKFSRSLKNNYEFRRLYSKGMTAASPLIAVYCRANRRSFNQIGITVSTKIGRAVHRNRIRRRLREIYRLNESRIKEGYDIVVVARIRSRDAAYSELEADFLSLCGRLGIIRDTE